MAVKPLKINIKTPTPSAADRMYARHQAIRKEKGLPDPSEYKKMDRDNNPENPNAGKYFSGSSQSVRKNPILATPKNESTDAREYDYEGDMAKSDLRSIIHNAQQLHDMLDDNTNLPEWVQSKITLAEDYMSTVANYMRSEMKEEVEHLDEKKKLPGLWANIHAKRKRGERPARPGEKGYPKTLNIEAVDDDVTADQVSTDNQKFPKKMTRKAEIVRNAAKKMSKEDQFQAKPVLDSDVNPQTNKQ